MATTLLPLVFRSAVARETTDDCAQRIQLRTAFRNAMANTRHYRASAEMLSQLEFSEPATWLARLPKVELVDFLKFSTRFDNEKPPRARKRTFQHPSLSRPRTALLAEGFRFSMRYHRIDDYRNPRLARIKPESIAGPLDTLRALARGIESGNLWIPKLRHSVVAFAGLLEGPISEEDLDLFWNVFKVPVHEQFYGFGGELLAWECEAHQGLHINSKNAVFEEGSRAELLVSLIGNPYQPVFRLVSGLSGKLVDERCACGRTGPRIVDLMRRSEKLKKQNVVPMAAAAC